MEGQKGRKIEKIDSMDSGRCGGPDEKIPPALGTNQITGFDDFRPLTSWKKIKDHMVQKLFQVKHSTFQSRCWYGWKISLFQPEIPSEDV